jgi:hypothetical protein
MLDTIAEGAYLTMACNTFCFVSKEPVAAFDLALEHLFHCSNEAVFQ